jgi:hypothetical protein
MALESGSKRTCFGFVQLRPSSFSGSIVPKFISSSTTGSSEDVFGRSICNTQ